MKRRASAVIKKTDRNALFGQNSFRTVLEKGYPHASNTVAKRSSPKTDLPTPAALSFPNICRAMEIPLKKLKKSFPLDTVEGLGSVAKGMVGM